MVLIYSLCIKLPYHNWACSDCNVSVDGVWQMWGAWSTCPVSCGGGAVSRHRSCDGPFHGGKDCLGNLAETQPCGSDPCPSKISFSAWVDRLYFDFCIVCLTFWHFPNCAFYWVAFSVCRVLVYLFLVNDLFVQCFALLLFAIYEYTVCVSVISLTTFCTF